MLAKPKNSNWVRAHPGRDAWYGVLACVVLVEVAGEVGPASTGSGVDFTALAFL